MLPAMRHVVTTPASADRTYEQREYRKWLKQDRKGFMTKKADLEKAALAAQADKGRSPQPQPTAVAEEPDEGSERVEALINRILDEADAHAKVASRVADAWDGLAEEDRQTILALVDPVPANGRPSSQKTQP
jgi:hypothetical protein